MSSSSVSQFGVAGAPLLPPTVGETPQSGLGRGYLYTSNTILLMMTLGRWISLFSK